MSQQQFGRRALLGLLGAGAGTAVLARWLPTAEARPPGTGFEITRTDAEWRRLLSPQQYAVLRQGKTERAGTSPLNREQRKGSYLCAGCALPVYRSETKFESGTGWPSFYAPIRGAIGTRPDRSLFITRTEVHCRRCGGHLGHVFDDGPPPTGKRYCMNGAALRFRPD
jgi:peptide-methionine (R)-S-oxide reductase